MGREIEKQRTFKNEQFRMDLPTPEEQQLYRDLLGELRRQGMTLRAVMVPLMRKALVSLRKHPRSATT